MHSTFLVIAPAREKLRESGSPICVALDIADGSGYAPRMERLTSAIFLGGLLVSAGCGSDSSASCGLDQPCALGSYCDAGVCRSACDPAEPTSCSQGVCTRYGQCVADQPDPDAGLCAAMVIEASFGTPTLVLLVDQSGSMTGTYSGGTRWSVLRDALIDPTTGVVTRLQSTMRFGLTLYTNNGGPTCPDLTTVDPALDNLGAIATVYLANQPEADTPTGESIDAVVATLSAFAEPGPKYIIVASDGEPDTCAVPNPSNGQPEAVAAAQAAFAAGIKLYFLSVGSGTISAGHMQDMANAGVGYEVGGTLNAPYYEAADAAQLTAAFDAITSRMLTCDLNVNGNIDPAAATSGVIYLDGAPLVLHQDWEPVDATSFELVGDACLAAQRQGDHTVTASFGCEASAPREDLSVEGGGLVDGGCSAMSTAGIGWSFIFGALLLLRRQRRS